MAYILNLNHYNILSVNKLLPLFFVDTMDSKLKPATRIVLIRANRAAAQEHPHCRLPMPVRIKSAAAKRDPFP